ncbi:cytochrome c oxidase assembly protein [Protaetiibacter larvae]|uniref:Bifunctional copper resistance protein CopD/cytochrome c oxidase assembly protein n=1 Tax=Protaetiibacter larvae TaxID=2592654 RepID=A0A5C1Y6Q5_9MICO|nr:cytochrome c oxidase assembly protein [Protaetiibacter larvae]QEO09009.1 bifunctional copper resistance protein CopD/cytochrome c oxidase assembly protein [Protaetiibacter larvae]
MRRLAWVTGPAILLLAALAALVVALGVGGGAAPPPFVDPGAVVRFGIPIATVLVDLGAAGTIGALALACFALVPGSAAFNRAVDLAAAAAAVWTVASAGTAFLLFQSLHVSAPTLDEAYGQQLGTFLTDVSVGRAWLTVTLVAAAATAVCFAVRHVTALALTAVGAALGLVPIAQQGHAGSTADHDLAITAIWLHVLFVSVWLGGLLALVLVRALLDDERLQAVLRRYSSMALVCFIVVAVSGYASAAIRVGELANLGTPYGVLVVGKVLALLALGALGAVQRRAVIPRVRRELPRWFRVLVLAELAFMGIAAGLASGLARTAPPVEEVPTTELATPTPAEYLTGRPLPVELTPGRFLTEWRLDLLWALVAAFAVFFYLAGVWRLRRRGDRWPWYRTALWLLGFAALVWVTNGAPAVYEQYLFSAHMLGHMILTMAIPVVLVLAAPVTLAARAIRRRDDGSRGGREWILWAVQSPVAGVLTNPLVAAVLFAGSLWLFYYTGIFRWAVTDHIGHVWMVVHFLITGYLFSLVLVGVDPVRRRPPYALRLVLLLATMAFHAFFGLAIMSNSGLMLADWFGAMGRTWGNPPLVDQQFGGGIAWSVGEIPTVILAIVVAIQWARSDDREAKRRDRAAERDGEAELAAYNEMLARRSRAN